MSDFIDSIDKTLTNNVEESVPVDTAANILHTNEENLLEQTLGQTLTQ